MNNFYRLALLLVMGAVTNTFANEISFISPSNGAVLTDKTIIQIKTPQHEKALVKVWLERKDHHRHVAWRGWLIPSTDFSIMMDVALVVPGEYELKAEYFMDNVDYLGSMDLTIDHLKKSRK
ncbi:MAG: hypothetical protein ACRCS8_02590 [Brevinema sp.]